MYRLLLCVAVLVATVRCSAADPADLGSCFESAYGSAAFVKLDERNKRVFLAWPGTALPSKEETSALVRKAESCVLGQPRWAGVYSLSVFSERKFAGYKTDDSILPFVKSGEWDGAYLIEYDRATTELTTLPLVDPQSIQLVP